MLINVIVPKLEHAVWEGNAKLVRQLKTVQMTAAKTILRKMLQYDESYSIESRTGNAPTYNKARPEKVETALLFGENGF